LWSRFDRKNYFYADLPQGYQISQFADPIVGKGAVEIELADGARKRVGITRLHLEQDAGKSLHDQHPSKSYIDLNRSGVALMEIVSEPDMRSPEEPAPTSPSCARSCATSAPATATWTRARSGPTSTSRPQAGRGFRTRCEVKNVNSIRFVMQAVEAERAARSRSGKRAAPVQQETRLFDTARGVTRSMRSKEEAHDYRYFPEPDLPPLVLTQDWVEALKASLPELPDVRRARYVAMGLTPYDAHVLTLEKENGRLLRDGREGPRRPSWRRTG
jgi:aspartyl-tRNA(Asn)/glutamyl-tRNA(Gln) amidotransferase subunit B